MTSPPGCGWNSGARWRAGAWALAIQLALASTSLIPAVPLLAQTGDAPVVVRAVRLGRWPDRARLVLETDRDVPFRLVSGASGEQLVMILDGIDRNALARALNRQIPADHHLIRSHHLNGGDPTSTRLALNFSLPVTANVFNLKPDHGYGYRLVVDLFEKTLGSEEPDVSASPEGQSRGHRTLGGGVQGGSPEPATRVTEIQEPLKRTVTAHQTADKLLASTGQQPSDVGREAEEIWLETRLNDQRQRTTVLALRKDHEQLFLSETDLRQWRITVPPESGMEYHGERFYALAELGIEAELDLRLLTLDLHAPAALFGATSLDGPRRQQLPLTPSPLGAFFNYDLSSTHTDNNGIHSSALLELGAFNGWGSGVSNFVVRDNQLEPESSFVRLDTTWRRDNPEKMRTLSLGDAITRGTNWSGAVRFGGMQWGSNFSTQPEFITMPLMSVSGEAALPSTVDLYVNDALRLRREVPPGPFTIEEVPTITGRGQTRLVVRDILGREQIITQDFYASQRMLRADLKEYSVELGSLRLNYGRESNDYGRALAAVTWRAGVTDQLTVEFHGQAMSDQQMVGFGASWLLPTGGVTYAALAASQSENKQGELLSLGLQRQGQVFSFGFDSQLASDKFARVGMLEGGALPSHQSRVYTSVARTAGGSLSLGYTFQDYRQRDDIEFANLSYSLSLGSFGYLSLSALHFIDDNKTTLQASFTLPLGAERTTASFGLSHSATQSDSTAQIQRSLPVGTGFGYRLQAGMGDTNQRRGSVSYQNDVGTWQLEGSEVGGEAGIRADARGGLALLGGRLFPSRRIDNSFAVVKVPGFADVRVYAENQEVARTNRRGEALVPRLRAYERNRLRIEQADLPLGANIGNLELQVAPYHRSGVTLMFPVKHTRDVFFSLVLDSGDPLPVGAMVITETGEYFPVGMRGEVFLTDLKPVNKLEARWQKQRCHFVLEVPESDEPLLELGEIKCSGITR